jgi:hypothetical protein
MTGCIEVNDHDPNIHMNETEIKPQVICCRNFGTYIFLNSKNIQINSARPMSDIAMDHKATDTFQWLLGYC